MNIVSAETDAMHTLVRSIASGLSLNHFAALGIALGFGQCQETVAFAAVLAFAGIVCGFTVGRSFAGIDATAMHFSFSGRRICGEGYAAGK
jgi:hypothetical protein